MKSMKKYKVQANTRDGAFASSKYRQEMKFCKTLQSISIGLQYLERDTASRSSVGDASTRLFDHARHLRCLGAKLVYPPTPV